MRHPGTADVAILTRVVVHVERAGGRCNARRLPRRQHEALPIAKGMLPPRYSWGGRLVCCVWGRKLLAWWGVCIRIAWHNIRDWVMTSSPSMRRKSWTCHRRSYRLRQMRRGRRCMRRWWGKFLLGDRRWEAWSSR